jgi:hypothetical protein
MPDITRNIMTTRPRHLTPIFLKSQFHFSTLSSSISDA